MDNKQVTAERIKELRELCEVKERHVCNDIGGCTMTYGSPACKGCHENITVKEREITEEDAVEALLCTLDALEASMQWEAEKDATIIRLTAERDAEKKRAEALDPAIEDMKQALCCGGFGELSASCSELWRIWDQNDPECASNTDAPTGAESEADHE